MNDPIVEVDGVTHRYGERRALHDVSFEVREGELFGLLGPNGGGKTTLLTILSTLRVPTGGAARIGGRDVVAEPDAVRRRIGVVFQHPGLDPMLTARENLRHQGHLYGLRGSGLAARIERGLARLGVTDRADDRVGELSGGLRRRVEVAKGLLHGPDVVLLDEPTTGFDPGGRRDLWVHLRSLAEEGAAVLVATHLMEEAERCDRVAILDRGSLVALGAPAALKREIRGEVITLEAEEPDRLAAAIAERFDVETRVVERTVRIERRDGAGFVPRLAEAFPGLIRSITVGKPTLEDVFVHRTGHRFWGEHLSRPDGTAAAVPGIEAALPGPTLLPALEEGEVGEGPGPRADEPAGKARER
ncbi:MAG: ABC transporter ATP-binding protein [Gemmatimonadetes bacterium]|nr:ABC transporter ATP-binding protein [Gemmatimonadota bacterium]